MVRFEFSSYPYDTGRPFGWPGALAVSSLSGFFRQDYKMLQDVQDKPDSKAHRTNWNIGWEASLTASTSNKIRASILQILSILSTNCRKDAHRLRLGQLAYDCPNRSRSRQPPKQYLSTAYCRLPTAHRMRDLSLLSIIKVHSSSATELWVADLPNHLPGRYLALAGSQAIGPRQFPMCVRPAGA